MTYGIFSDPHNHQWSSFAETLPDGTNSRLAATLTEFTRAGAEVLAAGGRTLVCAGDIFHTRGSIDPEVLNPVRDAFRAVNDSGVDILIIPGNHDLKSRDTRRLSSAVENLVYESLEGKKTEVFNVPSFSNASGELVAFVPWRETIPSLLVDIEQIAVKAADMGVLAQTDLFIHAGIDGVLSGVPAHGLTAEKLGKFGFRRVFAGHYHNHANMGHGVYSIGALSHQTWSDIGTKAGFLLVTDTTVTFRESRAPQFIDISGRPEDEIELLAPGNFVRFRGDPMTQAEVNELRDGLRKMGAKGVSIEVPRKTTALRQAAPAKGQTLDQSIEGFVKVATLPPTVDRQRVLTRAIETLNTSRAVTEEA